MPPSENNHGFKWNPDNLACRNTYTLLVGLKQLTEAFSQAGRKQMKQFAFWNAASTDSMRRLVAAGLAAQIDKFYMKVLLAAYEDGYDFHRALETMADTLIVQERTVTDLAEAVDGIY